MNVYVVKPLGPVEDDGLGAELIEYVGGKLDEFRQKFKAHPTEGLVTDEEVLPSQYMIRQTADSTTAHFRTPGLTDDAPYQSAILVVDSTGVLVFGTNVDPRTFELPELVKHFGDTDGAKHFVSPRAFLARVMEVFSK